jgi:hypothetical protein
MAKGACTTRSIILPKSLRSSPTPRASAGCQNAGLVGEELEQPRGHDAHPLDRRRIGMGDEPDHLGCGRTDRLDANDVRGVSGQEAKQDPDPEAGDHRIEHRRRVGRSEGDPVGQLVRPAVRIHVRPEHIYFTEQDGTRAGVAIYDIQDSSKFCAVAEPWFLAFGADCRFSVAMTPDDLGKTDLVALGRSWS